MQTRTSKITINNMIKSIEIENIKGIQYKKFDLDIIPNKPSILVAPNGFGKSSFAIAFDSLNNSRINLGKYNFYNNDEKNKPKICVKLKQQDNTEVELAATNMENSNTISREISSFVINNRTFAKGIYTSSGAYMAIEPVILIDNIPNKILFSYKIADLQKQFGTNGKVLPNIKDVLADARFTEWIDEQNYSNLHKASEQKTINKKIQLIISKINGQKGTVEQLLQWTDANVLDELKQIDYLNTISKRIEVLNTYETFNEVQSYLAAIELIWIFKQDKQNFKDVCVYNNYKKYKDRFKELLKNLNCTWKNINATEESVGKGKKRQLVVHFPRATEISNGQRDILTFVSMLFRSEKKLNKNENILIIDEIFDYLDDANLITAQYYISKFIKEYKSRGKNIYPLILTHLNPFYFKTFVFNKNNMKVYYLDNAKTNPNINVSEGLKKLLRNRKNTTIENDVSKYLLHFNPDNINKEREFQTLNIPKEWGKDKKFINYLNTQKDNYLNGQRYDPLAVCGALRIKIEEIAYNQLQDDDKQGFIDTHETREKLEYAETKNVNSPETHYLLGIIHNEGMHWEDKNGFDNISPIVSKLESLVIKNLIKEVFAV